MKFFHWLQDSVLGHAVRETLWVYPTMLTLHAIGMAVVVGLLLMVNLRVLGFARAIPLNTLDRLYTVAWIGFAINLLSGSMLFTGDAARFTTSVPFLAKIALIAAGGAVSWLLARALAAAGDNDRSVVLPGNVRFMAAISAVLWLAAITAGRLTAYIGAGAGDVP